MRFIFIFILIFNIAFGTEQFFNTEQSVFQNENFQEENKQPVEELSQSEETTVSPQEEVAPFINWFEEIPFDGSTSQTKNIYVKYSNYPSKIYTFQRFSIDLEAIITISEYTKVETRFINSKNIAIINPESPWEGEKNSQRVTNSYFFKVYTPDFQMPKLQVIVYNEEQIVEVAYLEPKNIEYTNIALQDKLFSNIIAKDLTIISHKTKQYSNNELLTVLEIDAINGNLEDFELKGFKEQTLMSLEEEYPIQKLIYNAVIPIYTKNIIFNYYNTQSNTFKKIVIPIKLEEDLVSTQTDLNPNESNVAIYKKLTAGILGVIFIFLYIWKRKVIYIIVALVLTIVFYVFAKPNDSIVIEEGTKIYILPTKNSTVFHITKSKQLVEILNKKRSFTKILFTIDDKNKTVGWIKESSIVED